MPKYRKYVDRVQWLTPDKRGYNYNRPSKVHSIRGKFNITACGVCIEDGIHQVVEMCSTAAKDLCNSCFR